MMSKYCQEWIGADEVTEAGTLHDDLIQAL